MPVVYANALFIADSLITPKTAPKNAIDSPSVVPQLFNDQHTDDMLHKVEDNSFWLTKCGHA